MLWSNLGFECLQKLRTQAGFDLVGTHFDDHTRFWPRASTPTRTHNDGPKRKSRIVSASRKDSSGGQRDSGDSIVLVDLVSFSILDTLEACRPRQPGTLSSKENAGERLCSLSGI
jgi:hypothetical protein